MTKAQVMEYFDSLKGSELTYPFDNVTEVYKVGGKMFGLIGEADGNLRINVKGDPEDNLILRNLFDAIIPGYHMNKTHWVSLMIDGTLEDDLIKRLISESYDIVFNKLSKKDRESIVNKIS
ncbi:MAG: MmcQ/YjbR family DNA-binding protein [Spirochaetaceae bacterium]